MDFKSLSLAELKKTALYKAIPPGEGKSSLSRDNLIKLLQRYARRKAYQQYIKTKSRKTKRKLKRKTSRRSVRRTSRRSRKTTRQKSRRKTRKTRRSKRKTQSVDSEVCEDYRVTELRNLAKEAGIRGAYKMNKYELCEAIGFTITKPRPTRTRPDSEECEDYTRRDLEEIAQETGVRVKSTMNKQDICDLLGFSSRNRRKVPTSEICEDYLRKELLELARAQGIPSISAMSKQELCRALGFASKARRSGRRSSWRSRRSARPTTRRSTKRSTRRDARSPTPERMADPDGNCFERSHFELHEHQKRVVDYLNNPRNHGILAVHGLGTGKTLTAVAASQCFLDANPDKQVIVVTKSALIATFRDGMEQQYVNIKNDDRYKFFSYEGFMGHAGVCAGNMLIVDEAHNLRAPKSKKKESVVACAATASKVLLLSATPIVNNTMDLANLIAMVHGYSQPDYTPFRNKDQIPVEYIYSQLRNRVSVFMREDADKDFPRRIDHQIDIPMTPQFYRTYRNIEMNKEAEMAAYGIKSQAFYSGLRTALLKQLGDSADQSKVGVVVGLVEESVQQGGKIVVYSNFVSSGTQQIAEWLKQQGTPYVEVTGKTSAKRRREAVDMYNSDQVQVMLISGAGGEGLDLKATRDIVIMDPPWNMSKLEQAIGRAIRRGSHSALPECDRYVNVYTLYLYKPENIKDLDDRTLSVDEFFREQQIKKKGELSKEILNILIQASIESQQCGR